MLYLELAGKCLDINSMLKKAFFEKPLLSEERKKVFHENT